MRLLRSAPCTYVYVCGRCSNKYCTFLPLRLAVMDVKVLLPLLLLVSNQSSRWQCIFINFLGDSAVAHFSPLARKMMNRLYLSISVTRTHDLHGLLCGVADTRISLSLSHDDTASS